MTQPGETYQASGLVFKQGGRIPAHVRVLWGEHTRERRALVINDPALSGWEYAQRMWVEEAFRDLKSHGWQLEASTLTCPDRMACLWIVLVVAYAWMLFLGTEVLAAGLGLAPGRRKDGSLSRRWSAFQEGRFAFPAAFPDP